jgi:hypothetical protein
MKVKGKVVLVLYSTPNYEEAWEIGTIEFHSFIRPVVNGGDLSASQEAGHHRVGIDVAEKRRTDETGKRWQN